MPQVDHTRRDAAILVERYSYGERYKTIAKRHGVSLSRVAQICSDPGRIRAYLAATFDLDLLEASIAAREVKGAKARAETLMKLVRTKERVGLAPAAEQPVNPALLEALEAARAGAAEREQQERAKALDQLRTRSRRQLEDPDSSDR